jgi:hypothetical protein
MGAIASPGLWQSKPENWKREKRCPRHDEGKTRVHDGCVRKTIEQSATAPTAIAQGSKAEESCVWRAVNALKFPSYGLCAAASLLRWEYGGH